MTIESYAKTLQLEGVTDVVADVVAKRQHSHAVGEQPPWDQNNVPTINSVALSYLMIPSFQATDLEKALALTHGVQGAFIKFLASIVPKEFVARLLDVSLTNLSNQYRRKELSKTQSESVIDFVHIWSELMVLFKDQNELVTEWLRKPKRPLMNKAPIELMDSASGRRSVLDMIERIKYGDFS